MNLEKTVVAGACACHLRDPQPMKMCKRNSLFICSDKHAV